jgi:voltage-gated potassium channel
VLIAITVVLAVVFYIAESVAQPQEYSFWRSLVWAFARYIDDPAALGGTGPVTMIGRIVMTILGIVTILIFAVPAGIIGASFTNAIEQEMKNEYLRGIGERLSKAFVRAQDSRTMLRHVRRYISIGTLQAKKEMTEQDVIEAVRYNPNFRLRNLATAVTNGVNACDRLAVEMFPYNNNEIGGCYINRDSNVTIVCPTAVSEAGIGNFTYYLALIGGFNYVSKEINNDVDDPESFYLNRRDTPSESYNKYCDILRNLANGPDKWVIFLISSERKSDNTFHFVTKSNPTKTGRESTIMDADKFAKFYSIVSKLPDMDDLKSECDEELRPAGPLNIAVKIGGGESVNALTIRVASEFVVWDPRYIAAAQAIANAINATLATTVHAPSPARLKECGHGYAE